MPSTCSVPVVSLQLWTLVTSPSWVLGVTRWGDFPTASPFWNGNPDAGLPLAGFIFGLIPALIIALFLVNAYNYKKQRTLRELLITGIAIGSVFTIPGFLLMLKTFSEPGTTLIQIIAFTVMMILWSVILGSLGGWMFSFIAMTKITKG